MASDPAVRAIQTVGEEQVRAVVAETLASFKQADGSYCLRNAFRYLVAGA